VEEVYGDFLRQMHKARPGPIIMASPGGGHVAEQFPTVARWVQGYGRIEIGQQGGVGSWSERLTLAGWWSRITKPGHWPRLWWRWKRASPSGSRSGTSASIDRKDRR
jgi:hypothetical protein